MGKSKWPADTTHAAGVTKRVKVDGLR